MGYSPRQWRAIALYIKKNHLRPELSAYPMLRFTNLDSQEVIEVHISTLEDLYDGERSRKKAEAREEAKEKKRQTNQVVARRYVKQKHDM